MTVRRDEGVIYLEGICAVEEAEQLLGLLHAHPEDVIDMNSCQHLHTAVLQVLLSAPRDVVSLPADPFLGRWIAPYLNAGQRRVV